jgi:cellulose biosynthesis protein BcsQ
MGDVRREGILFDATEFLKSIFELFEKPELRSPVLSALAGTGLICFAGGKVWERLRSPTIRQLRDDLAKERAEADKLREASKERDELKANLAYVNGLRAVVEDSDQDVWNWKGAVPPADFYARMMRGSLKVITVCNQKGGVGKTTLVACLAAYFETVLNLRVLVIDFDYQGSQTRMLLRAANAQLGDELLAENLLGGGEDAKWAVKGRELTAVLPNTRLVTCGQTFEAFEWRQLLRWLLKEDEDDIRFRLAELMIGDYVRSNYDVVLIDAPPRQSLGTVNALCASHAIIVPTVLDELSAETVRRFLQRVNTTLRPLNPALTFAGVVGTMTEMAKLKPHEERALQIAERGLQLWDGNQGNKHVFKNHIRHFTALAQSAGHKIAYFEHDLVQKAFDALGNEIADKLAMKKRIEELAS